MKTTVVWEIFAIDVILLFIGLIKPDWLADCSYSDKAPTAHDILNLFAHCSAEPLSGSPGCRDLQRDDINRVCSSNLEIYV